MYSYLLLMDEENFQGEIWFHHEGWKTHKLFEEIFEATSLGRFSPTELIFSIFVNFDNPLFSWNGIYQSYWIPIG
jgi:hypothetical protein